MRSISEILAGRKTYLVAGGVILVLLGLVFFGRLTPELAVGLLTSAVCGLGITFRSALARHQAEEIEILRDIALAGTMVVAHNAVGALKIAQQALPEGVQLAQELSQEKGS
jgi:hypothetical protein